MDCKLVCALRLQSVVRNVDSCRKKQAELAYPNQRFFRVPNTYYVRWLLTHFSVLHCGIGTVAIYSQMIYSPDCSRLDSPLQSLDVRAKHAAIASTSGYTCADDNVQQQLQQWTYNCTSFQPMRWLHSTMFMVLDGMYRHTMSDSDISCQHLRHISYWRVLSEGIKHR